MMGAVAASTAPDDVEPVPLVGALLAGLEQAGVRYCHWKSNESLARSLTADNDLDLLVDRRDATRASAVLADLGFRIARPVEARQIPALVDHLGLDCATGKMVHVQVHHQLVVGDDMTKNFRLPVEDAYLASVDRSGPMPVPAPEWELLVLVLRLGIKHCPWDALVSGKGRATPSERRELEHLRARADRATVDRLRSAHLPSVSARTLALVERAVERDSGLVRRAVTGWILLRALAPLGRMTPTRDLFLRSWRRFRRDALAGVWPEPISGRRLDTGGLLVGIVGGDGSGKSSTVAATAAALADHLPVDVVHLGKPPRSVVRRLHDRLRAASGGDRSRGSAVAAVLLARDRRRTHRRAERRAAAGRVVITDRYPLAAITAMDGPRLRPSSGSSLGLLTRSLAPIERRYYARIRPPDLLIVLRVSPEVAVTRRPEQDAEFVRSRAAEVHGHDWTGEGAVVVDADRPQSEVLAAVREAVWKSL